MLRPFLALLCALLFGVPAWAEPAAVAFPRDATAERNAPAQVPAGRPALATGELTTARFRIVYTARSERAAQALSRTIEGTRDHFQQLLGRDWPGVTEVRVGMGRDEMEAMALPGGKPPSWAAALAYPEHNLILLEAHSLVAPDDTEALRHELSHVALGQLGGDAWPRWFQEGLAVYLTGTDRFSLAPYSVLFRAVMQERVFPLQDLARQWPDQPLDVEIAYAQSASFVTQLFERHSPAEVAVLFDAVKAGDPFETAFAKAFHTSLPMEETAWRKDLPRRYSWLPFASGGTTLWAAAALICLLGYWSARRRSHRLRSAQLALEVDEDAAQPAPEVQDLAPAPRAPGPDEEKPTLH